MLAFKASLVLQAVPRRFTKRYCGTVYFGPLGLCFRFGVANSWNEKMAKAATPTTKELNLQVLLKGTATEMVVDVACLDTAGTVIAHLPAITRTISHDNKHSQAASFTKARTHACVLARQLQDSQSDIKELLTEVADWQKVASETTAQLQQRDLQVADLRRQLKEPKPRSRLGLASRHPSGPPKAEGTAPAASDELGHLHTQVEGVENTIAILRTVVMEQEQQLKQQDLQLQQQQPADQAHDRVAQQLELARTELRQHGSDVSAKVAETKQQAAQELQNAREQLQLHSQLLQEQDEEVQKLRKLLEVQHEQMTAQEQHHSQEMKSLQECIRDQRQHAAELQQRAVRQEAEDVEQQKLDGLLRQQRELLVNQDTALQAYKGGASPRASRRVLLACVKGWAAAAQKSRMGHLLRHAEDACQVACLKSAWHAWKGYSKQQGMYGSMITSSRQQHRRRSCRQAWQLWRRAHRAALAARQRQYSKMVYELLKELESSETVLHNKEQACKAAQYEVVSHQLQIEASRERLEGAKEEVGLSQEALLHEQQLTHGLQRQAREDIASADEAVGAVAQLLHQLAPDGDVHAAALALRQAKETAAGMLRLPKSLAQGAACCWGGSPCRAAATPAAGLQPSSAARIDVAPSYSRGLFHGTPP
ncbi:hypothetical protein WJX79_009419 [Trebouxia sp. C0005]